MGLQRKLNGEGIAHSNADSAVHARHVRQRKERQGVEWTGTVVRENAAEEFRLRSDGLGLENGLYFCGFGDEEMSVVGVDFEKHLSSINWSRRFYFGAMRRGEKVCTVRRKLKSPACGEFVVNFSPWQMLAINKELALWAAAGLPAEIRAKMLTALVSEIRADVVAEFSCVTGRDVVGSYVHFDSNKIHVGIVHSGVCGENKQVGERYLGTVGAWSTAQNRLAKLGLVDDGDHRLRENLEKFHLRFGEERQPLDIRLHDVLDEKFAEKVSSMGAEAEKRFGAAQEYYKEWKVRNRREAVVRSSSSQRIALETIRLFTPLLPAQVRAAISIARNATQVFQTLGVALNAISTPTRPPQNQQPEISKTL